ncbi:MAG: hypothetical protein QG584_2657 [Pseudomonadota bacterium]|nr:hypothetical protein [Pseudomonadota bacterium]MDQ5942504.1 hypothetical protein [Pseudomonadota bacterium]
MMNSKHLGESHRNAEKQRQASIQTRTGRIIGKWYNARL